MKTALTFLLGSVLLLAEPSFEVASVKRSSPEMGTSDRESFNGGTLQMGNVTLKQIVRYAYGISETQIFGGPKWMDDYRFDIVAKADASATRDTLVAMLQPLLADRFHLTLHRETRTVAGFALEIARSGIRAPVSDQPGGPSSNTTRTSISARSFPMPQLAIRLAVALQRPVVDMTGEKRAFDIDLKWAPDGLQATGPGNAELPTLFTAIEEQLGLKLESRKVPVEALVIDSAEIPGDN